jgi:hypothetical protein
MSSKLETDYLEFLKNKPKEEIIYCINPAFAICYNVLPVDLSEDKKTLHIVSTKSLDQKVLRNMKMDTRKEIIFDGIISKEKFDEAYIDFYKKFIPDLLRSFFHLKNN